MPRCRHQSIVSSYEGPLQIGSLNADPIAPRKDFGENGSLVFFVVMTPAAPAASEVRRIAPTFTGLLIWCNTTNNGLASSCAVRRDSDASGLCASTTIPCGVFVYETDSSNFSLTDPKRCAACDNSRITPAARSLRR